MKIQKLYRKNRIRFTAAALSISMLAALPGCSAGGNKNAEDVSSSAAESMSETADESTPEDTSNTTEDSSAQTTPAVEDITEDTDTLDDTQRNSINMLNYITVLTQEISDSKESRLYLESVYSALINNTYPNAIDSRTQAQITSMLDTLEAYRMIAVKRDRIEYIYEQNQAQAIRSAIPNPIGLLSAVKSGNALQALASVAYMAVDSVTSYEAASTETELQYLQSGWELDDSEAAELHTSRENAFNYMVNMVRENNLPGDYSLNEESVQAFVSWKNNTNLVRKIAWLETNQSVYSQFGPYWLTMARCYYDSGEYEKCLESVDQYESIATRIFRKDTDYAEILPIAILSAKKVMSEAQYAETAEKYLTAIMDNTKDSHWALRYFAAQTYLDLYALTSNPEDLDSAYQIAFDNVNVLVDKQKTLNAEYLADIQEQKAADGATDREKEEIDQYNKLRREERKTEMPPKSEALYVNCELLFALAEERNISEAEQTKIEAVLHENGEPLFLSEPLDRHFWFHENQKNDTEEIAVEFDGENLTLPASCLMEKSSITVSISGKDSLSDWIISEVKRPGDSTDCSEFMAVFTSETGKNYEYEDGDIITIQVIPDPDRPEETMTVTYKAAAVKQFLLFDSINFEKVESK